MGNSLALKLYLATRARAARAAPNAPVSDPQDPDNERLGHATLDRPPGPLVWVHSGQDRHALAARELAGRLRLERGDLSFLFTTSGTRRRAGTPGMASQFAPDDAAAPVRRFLDHWKPDASVWTEADMRPALTAEAAARNLPMFLVDAHTAPTETPGWRFWPGLTRSLLSGFACTITGDPVKAGALRKLGADPARTEIAGYLEEGTAALPCNEAERDALAADLSGRAVWLAARVADAEIEPILDTHAEALRRTHRLLLILVPEDPAAGPALREAVHDHGFVAGLRSAGEDPAHDTQIYIADTEGEMGLWYRLAPVSFLGQSLEATGGINPFEAAALGSAIIHGPNVRRYRRAYGRLASAGATRMVRGAGQLGEALDALLAPDYAAEMALAAWKVCSSGAEVSDRAIDLVLTALDDAEAH